MNIKKLRLLSLLAIPAVAVPFLATMTSCRSLNDINLKEVNINDISSTSTQYKDLPGAGQDLKDLVYGSSSFHKGNYCIFIANSEATAFLSWMFSGAPQSHYDNLDNATLDTLTGNPTSIGENAEHIAERIQEINDGSGYTKTDFGMTFLLEQNFTTWAPKEDSTDAKDRQTTHDNTNPFLTWTEDEAHNYGVTFGDYRRNDASAVDYRYVVNTLISLFPGNTSIQGLNTADGGVMAGLVYKDGKPASDKFLTSSDFGAKDFYPKWQSIYDV